MVEEIIEHSFAAWSGIQRLRIEPKPKPSNNTRNKINLRLCCLVRYNETFSGVLRQSIDGTQKNDHFELKFRFRPSHQQ